MDVIIGRLGKLPLKKIITFCDWVLKMEGIGSCSTGRCRESVLINAWKVLLRDTMLVTTRFCLCSNSS